MASKVVKIKFPISRDPPEGGTGVHFDLPYREINKFPISRDPPEGGTGNHTSTGFSRFKWFPISRDPPEGGTTRFIGRTPLTSPQESFQFLGIPPKGEREAYPAGVGYISVVSNF